MTSRINRDYPLQTRQEFAVSTVSQPIAGGIFLGASPGLGDTGRSLGRCSAALGPGLAFPNLKGRSLFGPPTVSESTAVAFEWKQSRVPDPKHGTGDA